MVYFVNIPRFFSKETNPPQQKKSASRNAKHSFMLLASPLLYFEAFLFYALLCD